MIPFDGKFDLLVVGAGPVGLVAAERAARVFGWKVVVIDKRAHIAGNCFDEYEESGVLVHRYGPHYFRTNDLAVANYLSQFTGWIDGNYVVKSQIDNKLYPFPINLTTLEMVFGEKLTEKTAEAKLSQLRVPNEAPRNSEEYILSRVGRELYEKFYLGYTKKYKSKYYSWQILYACRNAKYAYCKKIRNKFLLC